jgi:hypothetical protein
LAPWPNLSHHLQELQQLMKSGSDQSIRAKIQDIVPEYNRETAVEPSSATQRALAEPAVETMTLSRTAAAND